MTPAPDKPRQALKRLLELGLPLRWFMVRGPRDRRAISLTFDDGPDPENTPRVLDALARHGAKATFFLVGKRALASPEIVRRIAREGHALGHHSFHHADPERTSARVLAAESERTAGLIEAITGTRPTLFRPPHGKLSVAKLACSWWQRQTIVLWNVDPKDFAERTAEATLARLRAQPFAPGDIVLLHDTNERAPAVVDALVPHVRGAGLDLVTVPEWL